jgi:hypothetical protein
MSELLELKSDQLKDKQAAADQDRESVSLDPPFPYRVIPLEFDFFGIRTENEPTGSV